MSRLIIKSNFRKVSYMEEREATRPKGWVVQVLPQPTSPSLFFPS